MWRLAVVLLWAFFLFGGCNGGGDEGDLCDRDEDCDEGLVCVTQVLNCHGDDCWGVCERECASASACDAGDICVLVGDVRVCRPDDYSDPR